MVEYQPKRLRVDAIERNTNVVREFPPPRIGASPAAPSRPQRV
jgi:hypothetical protein